jgi:hypothetical protein
VLFTTLLAPFSAAAPALWLIIARAGALLALAGAFVLGTRLSGRLAGATAVAVIALSPWWGFNSALGNTEGLLAAAVLWAVIAHLDDRPRAALALLTAASLMRPEVWPFLGAYGVWLWPRDRRAVLIAGALVPLLWFGPDVIGAGGALGASHTARGIPSPGSAKLADIPVFAVFADMSEILTWPALIAAVVALVVGGTLVRRLGAAAIAWVLIVALMTLAGYAGNPRYLVAAAALGAVLAAVGAVRVAGRFGAAVLVLAVLIVTAGTLRDQSSEISARAASARALDGVIARAGGRDALVRCSRIRTSFRARSLLAWRLDLPLRDLDAPALHKPAVIVRAKWFYGGGLEPPRPPGYRALVTTPDWQVAAACGPAPQLGRDD